MQTQGINFSVFTYTECATMNANDRIVSQQIIGLQIRQFHRKIFSPPLNNFCGVTFIRCTDENKWVRKEYKQTL